MQVNQCIVGDENDCSTCRFCESVCPGGLKLDEIMPLYRYFEGSRGSHRNVFETLSKIMTGIEPTPWLKDVESDNDSDIAYFPGCSHLIDAVLMRDKKYSGASQAGVKVLNHLGIKPALIYGCCGHDLYHSGNLDEFEVLKKKMIGKLDSKKIVVGCPE